MGFVHLHCHTEYSALDAIPKVEDYVVKCLEYEMPAIAITDHGNLRALHTLYARTVKPFTYIEQEIDVKSNVKAIAGCEFYLTPNEYDSRGLPESIKAKLKRESKTQTEYNRNVKIAEQQYGIKLRFHCLIFAKNEKGMENLLTLSYMSWKDGFYYRPRIDLRLLKKYREGLIVTTSCVGGIIPVALQNSKESEAEKLARWFKKYFGDDFYFEIQPHNLDSQKYVNEKLLDLSSEVGVKLIATNDSHYIKREDYKAHEMLLDINSRATAKSTDRWRFGDNEFYFKNEHEMYKSFKKYHKNISVANIKAAMENTLEIAGKCEKMSTEINLKRAILPSFDIPKKKTSEVEYLVNLCRKGWKWRKINKKIKDYAKYAGISIEESKKIYKDRLELELKRIIKLKFVTYFLIIQDLIAWARGEGIMVGPGRGSSAASIVCYLIGITSIDPIRYDLLFDRFLSDYRIDYPDIDMDFEDSRRKEVFEYLFKKYGENNVSLIGTVDRMKGKQALQDVGRVLGVPMKETTAITKHIVIRPMGDARESQTVEDSFEEFEASQKYNEKYPNVLPYVKKLEGKVRQVGIHAAGCQIYPSEIWKYIPIEFREDKQIGKRIPVSSYDWRDCQELGLVKIDVLGLSTLTGLRYSIEQIKKRHKKNIDLEEVDLENKKVLRGFTNLKFGGIFQFDSIGMRNTCRGFTFDGFEDVFALSALYRPGAMRSGQAKIFISRKKNKKAIKSVHPLYDSITKLTYGVMVYQEQLMKVFVEIAGYQPRKSDIMRKKIAKSAGKKAVWNEERDFLAGAKKNGVPVEVAKKLFKNMSFMGSYAFNKAHASVYSMISYWGMYLKVYYPVEFFYGLLKIENNKNLITSHVKEAKSLGIKITAPDVNYSDIDFSIFDDSKIAFGLKNIKGCGIKAATELSDNKPYANMHDMLRKVDRRAVNKGVIKSLVTSGALKSMYPNTGALLKTIKIKSKPKVGEKPIWEWMLDLPENKSEALYKKFDKKRYKLSKEDEQRLRLSVSSMPGDKNIIDYYSMVDNEILKSYNITKISDIDWEQNNTMVTIKGTVVEVRYNNVGDFHKEMPSDEEKKRIGWGKRYAGLNIDDGTGIQRVNVSPEIFPTFRNIIDKGKDTIVILSGRILSFNRMVYVHNVAELDPIREAIKNRDNSKLNKFQKIYLKFPFELPDNVFPISIANSRASGEFKVMGLIVKAKIHYTKKDKRKMMFIDIQDSTGICSVTIWSDYLEKYSKKIELGNILTVPISKNKHGMSICGKPKLVKNYLKYN